MASAEQVVFGPEMYGVVGDILRMVRGEDETEAGNLIVVRGIFQLNAAYNMAALAKMAAHDDAGEVEPVAIPGAEAA